MPETEISAGKFVVQRLPGLTAPTMPATPASNVPPAPGACANCGTPLVGPYCAQCGQHVADFHRSVWRFVVDFFDNTICWDNKLFRTLGPLFRQPGFLTHEFMAGRRVRYVHPLRMFLFTSAVCLTLLQFSHNGFINLRVTHDPANKSAKAKKSLHMRIDSQTPPPPDASSSSSLPDAADDAEDDPTGKAVRRAVAAKLAKAGLDEKARPDEDDTEFERNLEARIKKAGGAERLARTINDGVMQRLSWVALALLPLFAAGLRSLYWRNDRYYFEHLIFSLHYHTFLLLFWTAYTGALAVVAFLPFHFFLGAILRLGLVLPLIYLYLALRRMYSSSRKRTLVKTLCLGSAHLLAIVIGVAAVGAFIFFAPGG